MSGKLLRWAGEFDEYCLGVTLFRLRSHVFGNPLGVDRFRNGDDAQGLVVSETTDELALKTVGGLVTRYKKAEIVHRTKQKLSIMPAGLEQTMTRAELIDLVEYLASLRKTAQ